MTMLEQVGITVKDRMAAIEPIVTNIALLNMKLSQKVSDEAWAELINQREQQLKYLIQIVRNPR